MGSGGISERHGTYVSDPSKRASGASNLADEAAGDKIIVLGTRRTDRTLTNSASAVDVISAAKLKTQPSANLLDTQLVRDRTYFIVERDGVVAGCGGWSWRATLYGGDDSAVARQSEPLDPKTDAARVRAMYTNPDFAWQGVGKLIIALCEAAARAQGFGWAEMMATLSGEPLYRACGYREVERIVSAPVDGVKVPLIRMSKSL